MKQTSIRKAVFPIAGLGSRFLPATKASPKEMLPVVDKPLIQYAVEEAYDAGIRQMIFVTGKSKRSVEDHFDSFHELECELERSGKIELLKLISSIKPSDMDCIFVRQHKALGLGHAILCAEPVVGAEPFAILLADELISSNVGVTSQLVEVYEKYMTSILGVQTVDISETERYGMVSGNSLDNSTLVLEKIIEKPKPENSPSRLAVAGRYILMPSIFGMLKKQNSGYGGEIQLTDAISNLLSTEKVLAYSFEGIRYDCGSKLGFVKAVVDYAVKHSEIGDDFSQWLIKKVAI